MSTGMGFGEADQCSRITSADHSTSPAYAASTCIQMPSLLQMGPSSRQDSTAQVLVVPTVTTKTKGTSPLARSSLGGNWTKLLNRLTIKMNQFLTFIAASSTSGLSSKLASLPPSLFSVGNLRILTPLSIMPLSTEECACVGFGRDHCPPEYSRANLVGAVSHQSAEVCRIMCLEGAQLSDGFACRCPFSRFVLTLEQTL